MKIILGHNISRAIGGFCHVQVLPSAALSYWAYETFKGLLEVKE